MIFFGDSNKNSKDSKEKGLNSSNFEIDVDKNTVMRKPKKASIKYVAHRGYSAKYVDNTIEAMHKAMDMPIHMVETDVRLNSKGEWWIFHDSVLLNMKGESVKFDQLDNSECMELEILSLSQFLSEYMKHGRSREVCLYLDIKGTPNKSEINNLVDMVYAVSHEYAYDINKFYMASFNYYVLRHLVDIRDMLFLPGNNEDNVEMFKIGLIGQLTEQIYQELQLNFVATDDDLVDITYIERIKRMTRRDNIHLNHNRHSVEVFVYVINDIKLIEYYINLGVDGVLSDDPTLFFNK